MTTIYSANNPTSEALPGSADGNSANQIPRGVMTERGLQGPEELEIADIARQIAAITDEVVAHRPADDLDEAA